MRNMKNTKMLGKLIDMAIKYPELTPDRVLIVDVKKKVFEKIITPSRLELVKTIKDREPESVGELAKMVKRPVEAVSRDLKILESYGVLELIQTGKTKKPKVEKDLIVIPIASD